MRKLHKKSIKWKIVIITIILVVIAIIIFKPYYKKCDRLEKISKYNSSNVHSKPLGWLRVQGTNIDFPIFYYNDIEDVSDPSYELGWSFENHRKLTNRIVLLSHNMKNVSSKPLIASKDHARFEQLMSYIYYDFVKKNKYIEYSINGKNELFKIYAVYFMKEDYLEVQDINKAQLELYIKQSKKNSYFKFDVDVNKNDQLLTLSTCTRFFGNSDYSFVVDARKVRNMEAIRNYQVTEKENYQKIKKILNEK